MKKLSRLALLALCLLTLSHFHIGNDIIFLPEPTNDFHAFQFHTLADYWDHLGEWSHWEYIE